MHDEAVDFEGTGPGGDWDLRGMNEAINDLREDVVNLAAILSILKDQIEGQALIAPAPSTIYMPRNRRNDVH